MILLQTEFLLQAKSTENLAEKIKSILGMENVEIEQDIVKCRVFQEESKLKDIIRGVREYIVENLENIQVKRIIDKNYKTLPATDERQMEKDIIKAIKNEEDIHEKLFVMRRNRIIETITQEYFSSNTYLNIDGFLNFRLSPYLSELEEIIDYGAENFALKRQYKEFIGLLSSYISTQQSMIKELNIVVTENREYIYYNENHKMISREVELEMSREIQPDYESDDVLISLLINKNPENIVIHNRHFMKKEVYDTISLIFGERVGNCNGCRLCTLLQ